MQLLYGSGLRLLEALALRIKDVDFARGQLAIRDPKWKHDRTTMLPASVTAEVREQIVHARLVHQEDLACGRGETWLPDAIARKLPNAARDSSVVSRLKTWVLCGGGGPSAASPRLDDVPASPASRRLASNPPALANHPRFQA